jgi:hypothetical protein
MPWSDDNEIRPGKFDQGRLGCDKLKRPVAMQGRDDGKEITLGRSYIASMTMTAGNLPAPRGISQVVTEGAAVGKGLEGANVGLPKKSPSHPIHQSR